MTDLAHRKNQTLFRRDNLTFLRVMYSGFVGIVATESRFKKWKRLFGTFSGTLDRDDKPEICRFADSVLAGALKQIGVTVSINGRGRAIHNICIKRFWRSLKFEAAPIHDRTDGFHAPSVIDDWLAFQKIASPHSLLGDKISVGTRIPTSSMAAPEDDAQKSGGLIEPEYRSKFRAFRECCANAASVCARITTTRMSFRRELILQEQ